MDLIVTHGPCHGILDQVMDFHNQTGEHIVRNTGCPQLLKRILEVMPKAHICGHIHEGYGQEFYRGIKFINASICDEHYRAANEPVVFEI